MTLRKNLIGMTMLIVALFISNSPLTAMPGPTTPSPAGAYLFLPAGTPLTLELNQTINSEEVEVGQTVNMRVHSNVVVNHRVLIRAGSFASGRVTKVNKSCNLCSTCDNACSSVTIVPDKALAADGSQVFLEGTPLTAKGACCGAGPSELKVGMTLNATVRDHVKIML